MHCLCLTCENKNFTNRFFLHVCCLFLSLDTVNTASRIETTSQANRIQLSQQTAQQLGERGKTHWAVARPELITAKGKGQLQTYFLNMGSKSGGSSTSHSRSDLAEHAPTQNSR